MFVCIPSSMLSKYIAGWLFTTQGTNDGILCSSGENALEKNQRLSFRSVTKFPDNSILSILFASSQVCSPSISQGLFISGKNSSQLIDRV